MEMTQCTINILQSRIYFCLEEFICWKLQYMCHKKAEELNKLSKLGQNVRKIELLCCVSRKHTVNFGTKDTQHLIMIMIITTKITQIG